MSTRIIGAIIMVHGDDSGLVLPPRIAPVQTMIIPIQQKKEGVLDKAFEIRDMLKSNFSVKVDDSDKSPGWKFSEQEIQGIPTRIEIGPKDIRMFCLYKWNTTCCCTILVFDGFFTFSFSTPHCAENQQNVKYTLEKHTKY